MSGAIVRDARPEDRAAIEAVTLSAYQQYATALPAVWDAYRRNIVATLADFAPADQLVAEEDGRIVGAVLLYPGAAMAAGAPARQWPEVRLLAVAPDARGRGIAAELMQACAARARRSGASALALHTTDVMTAAIRLYERLGFERAPDLDFEPAPGIVAKGFRLALGG